MQRLLAATLALLLLLLPAAPALAHGGTVVFDQNVGPYGIAIIHYDTLGSRDILFVLYLSEPDSGPGIANATITFSTSSTVSGESRSYPTTSDPGMEEYYNANISFPSDGLWKVSIAVDGPRGAATASFDLDVSAFGTGQANLIIWAVALLPVILAVGVLLFLWVRSSPDGFAAGDPSEDASALAGAVATASTPAAPSPVTEAEPG